MESALSEQLPFDWGPLLQAPFEFALDHQPARDRVQTWESKVHEAPLTESELVSLFHLVTASLLEVHFAVSHRTFFTLVTRNGRGNDGVSEMGNGF